MSASGLIPQSVIDEIEARTDIFDLVSRSVRLKKTGSHFVGLCPVHKEKSPSFVIYPKSNTYYCHGCGFSGGPIKFLMETEGIDFLGAARRLASDAGVVLAENNTEKTSIDKAPVILNAAQCFYSDVIRTSEGSRAVKYLIQRNISSVSAKQFGLGYSPDAWDRLKNFLLGKKFLSVDILETGLVSRKDERIYDAFRNRLMFPIRNSKGVTISFGGRNLGDEKPKYINGQETKLFSKSVEMYGMYESLMNSRDIQQWVVVEGYIDVIKLHQADFKTAVATMGTAFTEQHLYKLTKHCKKIVFCFDGDAAGISAAERTALLVASNYDDSLDVRFLFLPDGHDPDSFIDKFGPEKFAESMMEAICFFDMIIKMAKKCVAADEHNIPAQAARVCAETVRLTSDMPECAMKSLIIGSVKSTCYMENSPIDDSLDLHLLVAGALASPERIPDAINFLKKYIGFTRSVDSIFNDLISTFPSAPQSRLSALAGISSINKLAIYIDAAISFISKHSQSLPSKECGAIMSSWIAHAEALIISSIHKTISEKLLANHGNPDCLSEQEAAFYRETI